MKQLSNQQGIALIAVLFVVTLFGLLAGIAGSSWQTIVQRAKEQELLWRGGQIRNAIESYYTTGHAGTRAMLPKSLEELVHDPRSLATVRHLRKRYLDPMTGEDWVLVKEPNGRISGVRSSSTATPFKQDGFSSENEDLAGKQSYAEWLFVYDAKTNQSSPATPQPNQPQAGGAAVGGQKN